MASKSSAKDLGDIYFSAGLLAIWVRQQKFSKHQLYSRFCVPNTGGSDGKSACSAGDPVLIPGSRRSPGEGNGNQLQYSLWEMPWTEKPGGLPSMGSQRMGQDWGTKQEVNEAAWVLRGGPATGVLGTWPSCGFHLRGLKPVLPVGVGRVVGVGGGVAPSTTPARTYGIKTQRLWRTPLVVQWLRICLPVQGTGVQPLVQEDPTCWGATKPMCLGPALWRGHQNEKPTPHSEE